MTNRERILRTMKGLPVDRLPFFMYLKPWQEAIERWEREGMDMPYERAFNLDAGIEIIPVNLGYQPRFEPVVIREEETTRIIRDELGVTQRVRKKGSSIPQYLDYPVKCRADWEQLKARLDPDDPARFPDNWAQWKQDASRGEAILQLGGFPYGLFGTLRDMIGVEEFLCWFYLESDLIHEMMEYLTDFWLAIYEKVVGQVRVDAIHMWEDMSGKTGSMISPRMIRDFMLPNYSKISRFAKEHDIAIFSVDTDGNCDELAPVMMEGGINLMLPFEVQAGCDVNRYARLYPEFALMGGINKQAMWADKAAIDRELERIAPMLKPGTRFFPAPDHAVPPEVSYENARYFFGRLYEMLLRGGE